MKSFSIYLFGILAVLCFASEAKAQEWEQIGWKDGPVRIEAQLGNTLYGSANHAVYKSTDWGNSWKVFRKGLPLNTKIYPSGGIGLTVYHDSVYFRPPAYLNIGGIYCCSETDTEWFFKRETVPVPAVNLSPVDSLPYYPYAISDSIVILLTVEDSRLYRTSDRGNTWARLDNPLPGTDSLFSISFLSVIGKKVFIAVNYTLYKPHRIYESDDYGMNWKIALEDSSVTNYGIFGKENYYILQTSNGSFITDSTFQTLALLSPHGVYSNEGLLVGVQGMNLFAYRYHNGQADSLMASTDNGTSWHVKEFLPGYKLDNHQWKTDGGNFYASGIGSDTIPRLYQSTDQGNSWSVFRTLHFSPGYIVRSFEIRSDTILLLMSHPNDYPLYLSIDRGRSWVYENFQAPYSEVLFANGIYAVSPVDGCTFSFDLQHWQMSQAEQLNETIEGTYIYGNRLFVAYENDYLHYVSYRTIADSNWHICTGLDSLSLSVPRCDEHGILFATPYAPLSLTHDQGSTSMYYSIDTGSSWKKLRDSVTYATDVFIGSDYIFFNGLNELWRMPKSVLASLKSPEQKIPTSLSVKCFPNPVMASAHVSYSVAQHSEVLLDAFDIMGRKVASVASGLLEAGSYTVDWNTNSLPSGSYILRLTAGGQSAACVMEVAR